MPQRAAVHLFGEAVDVTAMLGRFYGPASSVRILRLRSPACRSGSSRVRSTPRRWSRSAWLRAVACSQSPTVYGRPVEQPAALVVAATAVRRGFARRRGASHLDRRCCRGSGGTTSAGTAAVGRSRGVRGGSIGGSSGTSSMPWGRGRRLRHRCGAARSTGGARSIACGRTGNGRWPRRRCAAGCPDSTKCTLLRWTDTRPIGAGAPNPVWDQQEPPDRAAAHPADGADAQR